MNDKRNASLRDALLKAVAIAAFTAVPATAFAPVASATVYLDDVNDGECDLFNGDDTGNGTVDDPFRISTVEDLAEITDCNYDDYYYYELTNDLDLTPNGNYNNDGFEWNGLDEGWSPISNVEYWNGEEQFEGNFNGNGYTISNLYIDNYDNDDSYLGLFGETEYSTISNLTVEGTIYADFEDYVGMISGSDYQSTFTNVHAVVDIVDGEDYVGGIVGETSGTRISRASTSGTIEGEDGESWGLGGIVGYANNGYEQTILTNVSSSVAINDISDGQANDEWYENVGGIVGFAGDSVINHATFSGSVFGNDQIGGIVGEMDGTFINDAVVTEDAVIETEDDDYAYGIGGIVGDLEDGSINNVTFAGTLDAYQESTSDDVYDIGGIVGYLWYSNIVNATVTADANISVRGNGSGSYDIGGIVGYAGESSITSSANFANFNVIDAAAVGGIAGELDGSQVSGSLNRGNIVATLNDVSFDEGAVGGIAGYIDYRSEITNSTNKGDITLDGEDDAWGVGGIGGYIDNENNVISDSYNTGDITGVYNVAGIVGYTEDDVVSIERNYSVGLLTAYGSDADGITTSNYDLTFPSNAVLLSDNSDNEVDAMELTAAELKSGVDLVDAGWLINLEDGDIVDGADWKTSSAFNSGYPSLVWETVSEDINEPVGLSDVDFANAVQFTGSKRFILTLAERNYLNSVAAVINEHEFGSVVIDVYYGNKPRLAEKRAKQVKRYLVRRFVGTTISWNVYQADGQNGVGTVNIAALVD